MTAANGSTLIPSSPRSSSLKRLNAESRRQVLSDWSTASKRSCTPSCSTTNGAGNLPAILTVHSLPMVSPCSSGSDGITVAQPPSARTTAPSMSRLKLLRQDFKRGVVGRGALLHARHGRVLVLDLGVEPVEAGRRPGHGDHA